MAADTAAPDSAITISDGIVSGTGTHRNTAKTFFTSPPPMALNMYITRKAAKIVAATPTRIATSGHSVHPAANQQGIARTAIRPLRPFEISRQRRSLIAE